MRYTIKKHKEFLMAEDSPTAKCSFFVVREKPARFPGFTRYGLIASKRSFRLAVQRNRAKRLLRDWLRYNKKLMLPGMDYVFIARVAILNADRTEGRVAMKKALRYLSHINNDTQNAADK